MIIDICVFCSDEYFPSTFGSLFVSGTIKWPEITRIPYAPQPEEVWDLAFHPLGNSLASLGRDKVVTLWSTVTGSKIWAAEAHQDYAFALAFDNQGKLLASGDKSGTVRLVDSTSGSFVRQFRAEAEVMGLSFHPKGAVLAVGDGAGNVFIWNVESGQPVARLR